jgi:hypothetical protein
MSKGLLWSALGGAAQAGTEIVNQQITQRDATQAAQPQQRRRSGLAVVSRAAWWLLLPGNPCRWLLPLRCLLLPMRERG